MWHGFIFEKYMTWCLTAGYGRLLNNPVDHDRNAEWIMTVRKSWSVSRNKAILT